MKPEGVSAHRDAFAAGLLSYYLPSPPCFVLSIFVQEIKPGVRRATEGRAFD